MKSANPVPLLVKLHNLERNGNGAGSLETAEELEKNLDPMLLKKYHKLKEKKGTGIAVLNDYMCSGCRMIYPETHEMLRYPGFVRTCEFCGRLLLVLEKSA